MVKTVEIPIIENRATEDGVAELIEGALRLNYRVEILAAQFRSNLNDRKKIRIFMIIP